MKYNVKIEILNLELVDLSNLVDKLFELGYFQEEIGDTFLIETVKEK